MRADAQRNYDHIVAVASEVFAASGTDASLDEIAKRAGVGPGTLYRHFPTRENLVEAAMGNWIDQIRTAVDRAMTSKRTPWQVLLAWLEDFVAHIRRYRGGPARLIAALANPGTPMQPRYELLAQANAEVLERLRAAGSLRGGVEPEQVCRLLLGVAAVADQGRLDTGAVRPMLRIIAQGLLRAGP
ncbi:MAG TPA: TetR/AcrR family transcriptional regulator [Sporichthyaceae bacterium]|jgi:AcrR family transcriptional regulator|nr:TetR/AcrR family transcriptional regulator [Sporichthyaceae bacterium]